MDFPSFESLGLGPSISPDITAESNTPQLVHQSNRTSIYRLRDIGFKVSISTSPSEEQLVKHLHEQSVSKFLPSSCHKRQVIDATTFNGQPALSFKWVSGITLKKWLQKVDPSDPSVGLNVRLQAAMAIAKTLSEFHDGGVVYNDLTPENIVMTPLEGNYAATFIDLSGALIYKDGKDLAIDPSFEKKMKEADLKRLGLVLNQLFQGEASTNGSDLAETINVTSPGDYAACGRVKRGKQHTMGEGLPLYLGTLVSALVDVDSQTSPDLCYASAKDVYNDLKVLVENQSNERLMKHVVDDFTAKGRLYLHGNMFYGRQVQMSMLLHLFQSSVALGNGPMMATISGYPGTGKSTLVNQIKKPLVELNGCFIEGKFDKSARPDTILASALDTFFGSMLASNAGSTHVSLKWRIHDAIGSIGSGTSNVLLDVLPNLQNWLSDGNISAENAGSGVKGIGSSHRLKFMFCKLIGAIACKSHPLCLYLDDLQWADEMTLDIIRMAMTDPDINHFLFIGCFRDNEVNLSHPLAKKLADMHQQGINILNIKVGPIEKECVNTLLSELLCLPPSLCQSLSTVVHSKTGGIVLFILRFLASLNDEGKLSFSMSSRRWIYNLDQIRAKEIHGDVVTHMTEHMKSLSKKMRTGLKLAACLGSKFDAGVLEKAAKDNEIDDTFLDNSLDYGFLQKVDGNKKKYAWSHDQIQQAAYELIPLSRRESFHLLIGSRLFMSTSPSEMKPMLFFIVDNMNRGSNLIEDQEQRYEVSQLNLEAGEKALSTSAFHSAARYLNFGLSLLGPESWEVKYELTIRLYDAASEALFVTGDFVRLSQVIKVPLIKARSFEDKLNILNNVVRALGASSKYEEGIQKCMSIVNQLGELIPTEVNANIIQQEFTSVLEMLRGKSREDLISLPLMHEPQKLAAMQFMNHAILMGYQTKPHLNIVLVSRLVKMTIEHGMCNISAFAFACLGILLVNDAFFDVERAYWMGRVAIDMATKLGATEMVPRIYACTYAFINIWKEPWQACLVKHLEAYDSGAKTGDIEYAITNLYNYVNNAAFGSGENLEILSQKTQSYARRAYQCNHLNLWKCIVVLHQLTFDLMGLDQNAFSFYSSEITEDSYFTTASDNRENSFCRIILIKKKYVACLTGDMNAAAAHLERMNEYPIESRGRLVSALIDTFVNGLIGFSFAGKHDDDEAKWTSVGLSAIQSYQKWVKVSDWNFSNKLYLLEAEYHALREDNIQAMARYNASIEAARNHRFVHEEGLAEEKLATYLLNKGEHDEAIGHFVNAKKCYEVWGARVVVERVNKAIEVLLPLCTT